MIRLGVLVPTDILEAISDQIGRTPRLMQTAYKRQLSRLRSQILVDLRQEPGKPRYPLRWKSERQWNFVMAKLSREGNLPYQRTHRLSKGWDIIFTDTAEGGVMSAFNETPYARFVQGDDAQPFHLDTGWVQAADVIVKWEDVAADRLIETYLTVSDPFAGVPK